MMKGPTCPHCGYVEVYFSDYGFDVFALENGPEAIHCGCCNKEYLVSATVIIIYEGKKIDPEVT